MRPFSSDALSFSRWQPKLDRWIRRLSIGCSVERRKPSPCHRSRRFSSRCIADKSAANVWNIDETALFYDRWWDCRRRAEAPRVPHNADNKSRITVIVGFNAMGGETPAPFQEGGQVQFG
eukprot:PhM_4_TR11647/c2_g1_i1/m.68101